MPGCEQEMLLEGVFMSAETERFVETSVLWRDWDLVGSEANYSILGLFSCSQTAIHAPLCI